MFQSEARRKGVDSALMLQGRTSSAKVQKVGKGLARQRWPLPRQSYDYTGCGLTYTRAHKASTTLPLFETFADDPLSVQWARFSQHRISRKDPHSVKGSSKCQRVNSRSGNSPRPHPNDSTRAASGQLSFVETQQALHLVGQLPEKRFYIFGNLEPIANPMSPMLHNTAFDHMLLHSHGRCEPDQVDTDVRSTFADADFGGASVTIPLKRDITRHAATRRGYSRS